MELRHIRYFIAAAEELNFSRASRRVHVSQPALSRLVRDLEDELGAALFVRERFGLSLTPAGKTFQNYSRKILSLCDEAMRDIQNLSQVNTVFNIGFFNSSLLMALFGRALQKFHERYPEIIVNTHELTPAGQIAGLKKKQIDLALLGYPGGTAFDEFTVTSLFEVELQAVIPSRHPLSNREALSLKELEGDVFVGYNERSFPGRNQAIYNCCWIAGFKPKVQYHVDSLLEALSLVGAGSGVCLMPSDVARLPHANATFLPIKEKLERVKFSAAFLREDERMFLRYFLDCIKNSDQT